MATPSGTQVVTLSVPVHIPSHHIIAHLQPETLRPHHWRAHQSPLAPRAAANYIQDGDADVPCTARLCTIILGDIIHMCLRHAALTHAQVHLHWTAWRSNLPSVNSRGSCSSCCWCEGVERPAKRCSRTGSRRTCSAAATKLTLNDTFFSQ